MHTDTKSPIEMSLDEIKLQAAALADHFKTAKPPLPYDVRTRFVHVRAALYQRGIYDPVLVRFDSATVPAASLEEIAGQLLAIAAAL